MFLDIYEGYAMITIPEPPFVPNVAGVTFLSPPPPPPPATTNVSREVNDGLVTVKSPEPRKV